jgi:hypothetical protein
MIDTRIAAYQCVENGLIGENISIENNALYYSATTHPWPLKYRIMREYIADNEY